MTSSVTLEAVLILGLILANGLFAMSEMALVAARKARLQQRADKGSAAAETALTLASEPENFLSAIQIGITLVGILAGAFGGATIAAHLSTRLKQVPALVASSDLIALFVVVLIISYLTLVIGELAPKRLALNSPERIAMLMARPTQFLVRITAPAVRFLTASTDLLLRLLRVKPQDGPPVTEEEIRALMTQATEAGVFEEGEEDLVSGIFRLGDLRAVAVMTPRTEMLWLDKQAPPDETRKKIIAKPHARYAVMDGHPDNVAGVVLARDLLTRCLSGEPLDLGAVMHPPVFLPESTPALEILRTFLRSGDGLCFIIDEYGGLQGVAAIDDVVHAIGSDMTAIESAVRPTSIRRPDGSWLVDGLMTIEALKELFDLGDLPNEEINAYQTLGGYVMASLGRIPQVADQFTWEGLSFEVVDMDGRRVDKVLIRQTTS